ncbi:hypothetical protein HNP55_003994 [Paucibacter oligotrophus]|uniref:Uncharacterized protein n=1 Tax=Roseateles oligotrophus TaxID=1769250 RepID=A0A840LA36_9BURK|nr:hypothetical protein [Roseateles oligotrophus]MBB4845444.1 hypothetical protein [Roseateles oligotrophus]
MSTRQWAALLLGLALVAGLVVLALRSPAPAEAGVQLRASAASAPASAPAPANTSPLKLAARQDAQAQRQVWQQRLERAQQSLDHYKQATRYPPESRPISEHPDQRQPFAPVVSESPMRTPDGKGVDGVRIVSTQDRVFMSGTETVNFSIAALDASGKALPLLATRALAFDLPDPRQALGRPQVGLSFVAAGDGVLRAAFNPASQGFADFAGTLRVQVQYNQNGRLGQISFDTVYQPLIPAQWTGQVREQIAQGSLDFLVGAKVAQAGRYVVSARVEDAKGQMFALLQFNEEVEAGQQEFRLRLFGKLVQDLQPTFPLRLRDVQGFLLVADRFPDRAMMPRWPGLVYSSASHALGSFSSAEWTSEERQRYLDEYGKDVSTAQQKLADLNPPKP